MDGVIARVLKQKSNLGAKLDSIADLTFLIAIFIVIYPIVIIPNEIWIFIGCIAVIRISAYLVGYMKHRTFSSVHTYTNKATGAVLFMLPILYSMFDSTITVFLVGLLGFISSCEELLINVLCKELNRDRKSIFDQ